MCRRFLTVFALWSFSLRYSSPGKVLAITVAIGSILGLYCVYRVWPTALSTHPTYIYPYYDVFSILYIHIM